MTMIELGKITEIRTGRLNANQAIEGGKHPFFTCSVNPLRIDDYAYDCECVLVAGNGDLNVKYYNGKFNAYQRVYIVESIDKSKYDVKFLYYFLQTHIDTLRRNSIGGVIKYIRLGDLTNAEVPNFTIETQRKIVTVIEKSEKALVLRKQQIKALSALKQSVFLDIFGDPNNNLKNWNKGKLEKHLDSIKGGWSPKCHSRIAGKEEWGVLIISSITQGDFNDTLNKALPSHINAKEELEVQKNDLLFNRKNTPELVGTSSFVYETRSKLIFPDTIFRIETKKTLNKIYLWQLLNHPLMRNNIKQLASGSAKSMSNISQRKLKDIEIIIPDLDRQEEFARIIQGIDNRIHILSSGKKELNIFYESLLHKAFKGELFKEEIKA